MGRKEEMKLCENCGKEFEPDKHNPNQRFCCRSCFRKCYNKKWRRENREKLRKRMKKWRQENKEHYKKYCQENKEKLKEYKKRYYQENEDRIKKYHKKYVKEHLKQYNLYCHKRRARKRGNGGSYSAKEIREIRKESEGICPGYKTKPHFVGKEKLEIDHIIPLVKGGRNDIENIQLLCKSCNRKKGIKI